jgi:ABC-2 type transport system permease protein
MFLTLNVLAIGSHMVEDRARGRLQRLQVAGGDSTGLLAGKLGARWAVAMLQSLAMFGIGVFFFHIHVAHLFAVAGFMSLYVVALGALGLVLGAWFRDQEKAQAVAVWGTIAACALGGVWWNVEGDPGVLGTLAFCMPTGWGIAGLEALVNGGASVTVWLPCVLLLALAVVASMTAGRLLRR